MDKKEGNREFDPTMGRNGRAEKGCFYYIVLEKVQ